MLTKRLIRAQREKGVVLLVVLGMLFLFAAVGLTFAVIARTEGVAARNFKRQLTNGINAPDPTPSINEALSQLLYDTTEGASAVRGHSLARDMFGGWSPNGLHADPRADNASAAGEQPN